MSGAPDTPLPRRWRWLSRLAGVAMALMLLSWGLVLIAWLALHWVILPNIDHWRPSFERLASQAIGRKLSIGAIRVQSSGWVPALELQDVRLYDRDERVALQLPRVQAALAQRSLLSLQLRFAQLLIDGARLDVRRDAGGRWFVAGLDWDTGADTTDHGRAREWLLDQGELVIRNGTLRWTDEQAGTLPMELTQLELVLRNGVREHALRVDASPAPELGQRFSMRARWRKPLLAADADWRRWSGTLYAELPEIDLDGLRRHVVLPFELAGGQGALRAWIDVAQGVPNKATLDLALRDVQMRLAPQLRGLALKQVQGRLQTARDAEGVRLGLRGMAIKVGEGPDWPAGNMDLAWRQTQDLHSLQPSNAPVTAGEFSADRLDLAVMALTAERLPLGEALRKLLAELAPRGIVEGLKGSWQGSLDAPDKYQVSAGLSGLSLQPGAPQRSSAGQPAPGRPGLRNAQLRIDASERGGDARLAIDKGALIFPGVWQEPELALDTLDAQLAWRITPVAGGAPAIAVELKQARLANADLQGEINASWKTGAGEGTAHGGRFPGLLDLRATLQRGRAESVARYLPLGIDAGARDYVQRAILGGNITSASFKVRGDLWDFPFQHAREGELRIQLKARDLRYAYLPGRPAAADALAWASPWPVVEQLSGELDFNRRSMHFRGAKGRLLGYEWDAVQGGIADLSDPEKVLVIEGQGGGPAADLLRFVRTTPLAEGFGPSLPALDASGASTLQLALDIPFAQPAQTHARGSLQLNGGELRLHPALPPLLGPRAAVDFTHDSFTLRSATARIFGGEASFDGGLGADGALRIDAQGVATAEALRALPPLAHAAAAVRGQAPWRATLAAAQGRSELDLSSSLVGLQIDLPAPLDKPAAAAWPLRVQHLVSGSDASAPAHDSLKLSLGDRLALHYQRDRSGAEPKLLRGSIAVRDALPPPSAEVTANLKFARLDVDAWRTALERLGLADDAGGVAGYLPRRIHLRADELRAGGKSLSRVVATLQRRGTADAPLWQGSVTSDQLVGEIDYRAPASTDKAGRVQARLERLSLPQTEVAEVEQLLSEPPASVPALDIAIQDFELRGRKLGRVQIVALNRPLPEHAGQREWQLDKLQLDTPEAQLRATGRWSATGAHRMVLDFKLELADSGAFVERLSGVSALRGGKGAMQGRLSWAGSPLTLDYPSLDGTIALGIDAGQFMNVDPGSARLIGVLGLQALSRRLSLDFRDLFEEGFAFDNVTGNVQVARGVAVTQDMQMRSLQATVLMRGSADLQRETQDLRVLVVPIFDASGAALASMAINPAIGLGALFAQWLLREPLMAAGTREFHVTGPWSEPKVESVQRAIDAPLLTIEPAASAPPGRATPRAERSNRP